MKKAVLILIFILLACVAYSEPYVYFNKLDNVNINVPCNINSSAGCDSCNVSIIKPDGSLLVTNSAMSKTGLAYNYTIGRDNKLGQYQSVLYCQNAASNVTSSFVFEITDNGQKSNDYAFIIAAGIIAALLLVMSFVIDKDRGVLRLLCLLFAVVFMIFIPGYFIAADIKLRFFEVFIGFVVIFAFTLAILGVQYILVNMGVIKGKPK